MPPQLRDLLPSWNEGTARQAILDFVAPVTKRGGADFVPENEPVAVFDNDGTLWCEMPVPVQAFFTGDRIRSLRNTRSGRPPSRSSGCSRVPNLV